VWELALVNRAAIAREMEVEVYSVPDGSPLTDDSDAWSRARDLLRDGVAGSLDLLSLVKTVALPASTTPVVLALLHLPGDRGAVHESQFPHRLLPHEMLQRDRGLLKEGFCGGGIG